MRGLILSAAMVFAAASPAAANWGYNGSAEYGYASYGASYGSAGYGYGGYGYGGYGYGYGNLSDHGAALPSWGDCPCCAGAWAGYCEEKAARAANRHCDSCGNGCGNRFFGRKCNGGCATCGSNGDCGCNGGAAIDAAPNMEQPIPPSPSPDAAPATPPPAPAAAAAAIRFGR
jgi:hypothetical protein